MRLRQRKGRIREFIQMRKAKGRFRFLTVCLLLCINVVFVGIVGIKVRDLIFADSAFRLGHIKIIGNDRVHDIVLINWAKPLIRKNIFEIDIKKLQRRVFLHPLIKQASVRRKLPNQLIIDVVERRPVLQVHVQEMGKKKFTVDEDGYVVDIDEDASILPKIYISRVEGVRRGKKIQEQDLINALEVWGLYSSSILRKMLEMDYLEVDGQGNVQFISLDGLIINIGKDNYEKKMMRLVSILEDLKKKSQHASLIDLRFNAVPIKIIGETLEDRN